MTFQDAIASYDRDDFISSQQIFKSLLDKTTDKDERELYMFNLISCYLVATNWQEFANFNDEIERYLQDLSQNYDNDENQIECLVTRQLINYLKVRFELKKSTLSMKNKDEIFNQIYNKQADFFNDFFNLFSNNKNINNKNFSNNPKYNLLLNLIKTLIDQQLFILWERNQFCEMEKLLAKVKILLEIEKRDNFENYNSSMELSWQKNMGHVLYMMDTRHEQCLDYYELLLPKSDEQSILNVDGQVLANLCVVYVLTGHNSDAEQLIKEVEEEENEFLNFENNDKVETSELQHSSEVEKNERNSLTHLQHINLTIETLYCVKGNFQFGLNRMFKTLEPLNEKMNFTTWLHAKRCIVALLNQYCKQMSIIEDELFDSIIKFLIKCEIFGKRNFKTKGQERDNNADDIYSFIAYEARYLRSLCLTIYHD